MNYKSRSHRFGKRKKLKFKGLFRATLLLALVAFILFTYRTVNLVTVLQGRDGYFQKNVEGRENYLIAYEGEQLNTAFIISVDKDGAAYFIDIPNNSRVDSQNQKIMLTELYKQSGSEGLLAAVHNIFNGNMKIDNYMLISEGGLGELVDKLGGINFEFEKTYNFGAHIWNPGDFKFDKEKTLTFFSHIDTKDRVSYMERQVKTLQSIFNEYLKFGKSITLVSGISSIDSSMETNMSVRELAWFRNMIDHIGSQKAHFITVPGKEENIAGKDFWIINNALTSSTLQDIVANRPIADKGNIAVEVLNGNGRGGVAATYKEVIETLGYTSSKVEAGNADHHNYQVTTIIFPEKYRYLAEEIAAKLGVSAQYQVTDDETITVILGRDLN